MTLNICAKFKIQNLAAESDQISNFEFCGVGPQSVAVVASRWSPSSRRSAGEETHLQNSKFKIWPRGAAKFWI